MIWRLARAGLGVLLLTQAAVLFAAEGQLDRHGNGWHLPPSDRPIVVLGSGLNDDLSLTRASARRVLLGIRLAQTGRGGVVVFSGGPYNGYDVATAVRMRAAAISLGLPPERALIEDRATSTFENLRYSMQLLVGRGLDRPILVTDALHMTRTSVLAWQLGIEPGGIAVADNYPDEPLDLRLLQIVREVAAWWHNLGRAAVWAILGVLGWTEPEREQFLGLLPDLG